MTRAWTDGELEEARVELQRREREATEEAFRVVWERGREAGRALVPYWEGVAGKINLRKTLDAIQVVPKPESPIPRLEGRRDNARRTSERHPDELTRRSAADRVKAYDIAVDDVRELLGVKGERHV